jgi:hypothetical protein
MRLITIVFLNRRNHPEDGRITGRNVLVTILRRKYINEIKVHLLVLNALRAKNIKFSLCKSQRHEDRRIQVKRVKFTLEHTRKAQRRSSV